MYLFRVFPAHAGLNREHHKRRKQYQEWSFHMRAAREIVGDTENTIIVFLDHHGVKKLGYRVYNSRASCKIQRGGIIGLDAMVSGVLYEENPAEIGILLDEGAFIGPDAKLYGKTILEGNARLLDHSIACESAYLKGDATLSEYAMAFGGCKISGNSKIFERARICGQARVWGRARVRGDAIITGHARISGSAKVTDFSKITEDAWIDQDSGVYGNSHVSGEVTINGRSEFHDEFLTGDAVITDNKIISGSLTTTVNYYKKKKTQHNIHQLQLL